MRSNVKKTYYFHAQANSLGGFIEKPIPEGRSCPGFCVAAFRRRPRGTRGPKPSISREIVSCRAAYTRVSGRHGEEDGVSTTVVTSVLERLNILEIVKAERIVAQVSAEYPYAAVFLGFPLPGLISTDSR